MKDLIDLESGALVPCLSNTLTCTKEHLLNWTDTLSSYDFKPQKRYAVFDDKPEKNVSGSRLKIQSKKVAIAQKAENRAPICQRSTFEVSVK